MTDEATTAGPLTREQILGQAGAALAHERVDTPKWGGPGSYVLVWEMTGNELSTWQMLMSEDTRAATLRQGHATLAAMTIKDEQGVALFTLEDVTALGALSGSTLQRVFGVATRLNGLTEEDVDELVGN